MPNNTKPGYRIKLGPVATDLLDRQSEQTPTALDLEIARLLQTADRVAHLETQAASNTQTVSRLLEINSALSSALSSTSDSVTHLTDMIDHRTREFEKLLIHISTMVGSHLSDGAERDRLHARLQDIEKEFGTQLAALSSLVQDQKRSRQMQVQNAIGRAEEERLTIVEEEATHTKPQPERGGTER
ncbi:hypothetical protein GTA62_20780 [Roseobacter sp. HKCCD9010]|uniref:hypothetical protein n=1 Tax=unclassified Roseobacter TaxID=196798 RepID=UPI001491E799|nr:MULTISPECIES: hypothetical protein [unclassified Roseobacter]MBF9052429.1 hypothetical protein [Rhodobacterales bacterium HKCCD4356]NNV14408.1 hypothetical protein [Roseobacter sp. HKCCD7357]NNV18596.1 hypothetical protein [Roseobacter sp. HKCCD8768]NNV28049.1 hypothetical protein [Roseobacter sp. HKCCD8192]NNV32374.1 hypothetical protein [Roseobacter sp. HKCCD9061]